MPLPPSKTAVARTFNHAQLGLGELGARFDPIVVNGFEPGNAVGVEAEFIGGNQHLGADGRFRARSTQLAKDIAHESLQCGAGDPNNLVLRFHGGYSLHGSVGAAGRAVKTGLRLGIQG